MMCYHIPMTERQAAILVAIIEQYAEVAVPVGSVTLAKLFGVSSATIRSEMARLEELDMIHQPHTSAGLKFKLPFIQYVHFFEKKILIWNGDSNQIPTNDKTYIYMENTARWRISVTKQSP